MPDIPLPLARAMLYPLFRYGMDSRVPWRVQRALLDAGAVVQTLPKGTRVDKMRLGGRPGERVTAGAWDERIAVLYLHGGGYAVGSPATHRSLAAHLAGALGGPVYVPDYRLAPEHPYPAALDDAEAAYLELISTGLTPERLAVAGDSAGGGLSLALALRLRDRHGIRPAALGLIAPWADPNDPAPRASEASNWAQPGSRSCWSRALARRKQERDLIINRPWSLACAAAYLGGGDGLDPGYAPLLGELSGLPPTYVQVDEGELLRAQCGRLVAALREAGVETQFSVTRGLWHVAQLQASLVAPAAAAVRELAGFLGESLQPA